VREAGRRVLIPTRSSDGATALKDESGTDRARVLQADVGAPDGLDRIESASEEVGGLHHVVAPIGSWWQKGESLAQPVSELEILLDTFVTTQFRLLRRVAPYLSDTNGSYTLVTGTAGETFPDGAGLLVVAVRGQYPWPRC
jgi:NADP-dependent 3-hydroxy acid dehydrogenase YdfG